MSHQYPYNSWSLLLASGLDHVTIRALLFGFLFLDMQTPSLHILENGLCLPNSLLLESRLCLPRVQ